MNSALEAASRSLKIFAQRVSSERFGTMEMGHIYSNILPSWVTGITLAHTPSTDVFVWSLKRSRPQPLTVREAVNYRLWRLIHLRQHRVSLFHPLMVFLGQKHILSVSVAFLPEFSSAHFTGYYSYHSLFLFKCVCAPSCKRAPFVPFYFIYLFIQRVKSTLINMSTDVHNINMADLATPANSALCFGIFLSLFFLQITFVFVSIFSIYSQAFCRHTHFEGFCQMAVYQVVYFHPTDTFQQKCIFSSPPILVWHFGRPQSPSTIERQAVISHFTRTHMLKGNEKQHVVPVLTQCVAH